MNALILGFEFDHGYPPYIPQKSVIAAHFSKLAADSGSSRAQLEMGNRYYDGRGVEINFQQADVYWEAAKQSKVFRKHNIISDCCWMEVWQVLLLWRPMSQNELGIGLNRLLEMVMKMQQQYSTKNIALIKGKNKWKKITRWNICRWLIMPRWKREQYMDASGAWRMPSNDMLIIRGHGDLLMILM